MDTIAAGKRDLQLDDIAGALRLSKSTVSRAISGKGRVGSDTRRRVLDYIERYGYRPNMIAKSLAQSRTYNIGVVLPADCFSSEIPFFQNALIGVIGAAEAEDYDAIVVPASETNLSSLRRIVQNGKVDGLILTRAVEKDPGVAFLKNSGLPFVLIGSCEDASVVQVDTDQAAACRALTQKLVEAGVRHPAFLCGNPAHLVNRTRLCGFLLGIADGGVKKSDCRILPGLYRRDEIYTEIDALLGGDTDAVVCGDDYIASRVMARFAELGVPVPGRMRVASFFNSVLLETYRPAIPAVDIDAHSLGRAAAERLLLTLTGAADAPEAAGNIRDAWAIKGVGV